MALAGVVTDTLPNPEVIYVELTQYHLIWPLNRENLRTNFPESILTTAIQEDPTATLIPINHPDITPAFMAYLYLLVHYSKFFKPPLGLKTRPGGLYFNMPLLTILDRDYVLDIFRAASPFNETDLVYTEFVERGTLDDDVEVVLVGLTRVKVENIGRAVSFSCIDGSFNLMRTFLRAGLDIKTFPIPFDETKEYLIRQSDNRDAMNNYLNRETYQLVYILVRANVMMERGQHQTILHDWLEASLIPHDVILDILTNQRHLPANTALDLAQHLPVDLWPTIITASGNPIIQNLVQRKDGPTLKYILDQSPDHYGINSDLLLDWAVENDWPDYVFEQKNLQPLEEAAQAAWLGSIQVYDAIVSKLTCEQKRELLQTVASNEMNKADMPLINLLSTDPCIRLEDFAAIIRSAFFNDAWEIVNILTSKYGEEAVRTLISSILTELEGRGYNTIVWRKRLEIGQDNPPEGSGELADF